MLVVRGADGQRVAHLHTMLHIHTSDTHHFFKCAHCPSAKRKGPEGVPTFAHTLNSRPTTLRTRGTLQRAWTEGRNTESQPGRFSPQGGPPACCGREPPGDPRERRAATVQTQAGHGPNLGVRRRRHTAASTILCEVCAVSSREWQCKRHKTARKSRAQYTQIAAGTHASKRRGLRCPISKLPTLSRNATRRQATSTRPSKWESSQVCGTSDSIITGGGRITSCNMAALMTRPLHDASTVAEA